MPRSGVRPGSSGAVSLPVVSLRPGGAPRYAPKLFLAAYNLPSGADYPSRHSNRSTTDVLITGEDFYLKILSCPGSKCPIRPWKCKDSSSCEQQEGKTDNRANRHLN